MLGDSVVRRAKFSFPWRNPLSLVDEKGKPEDCLRLHDIYNLNLAADLVVLSACNTGFGKEVRGESLVGIVGGMYAGAARFGPVLESGRRSDCRPDEAILSSPAAERYVSCSGSSGSSGRAEATHAMVFPLFLGRLCVTEGVEVKPGLRCRYVVLT